MDKMQKWFKVLYVTIAAFFCYECIKYTLLDNVHIVTAAFCAMIVIRSAEIHLQMAIDYRNELFEWREVAHNAVQELIQCRKDNETKWQSTK